MIAIAALRGPVPKLGVVLVAMLAAAALLSGDDRRRAMAMLGALVLSPVLLLADIWHSPQLHAIHRHPAIAVAAVAVAVAALVLASVVLERRPALFAPLAVAALPFRVPIQAGDRTSNLLVPLYLVVAAGSLAFIGSALRRREVHKSADHGSNSRPAPRQPGWLQRMLALYVVLYAVQAVYSSDFERALQNMVFFYVPFTLLFYLLARVTWTAQLLRRCLAVITVLALAFAAIGFVEYATKTIILNPKLVVQNDLHTYFTVNSVFFDPDIFGRFLALVMIALAAVLLYHNRLREQMGVTVVLAVLWCGLLLTLSRSSLVALLVGLGTLAAVRWRASRTLWVAVAVVALGALAVALSPKTFGLNQGLNGVSSGRGSLVSGGLHLFADRPLWGYGSGSFENAYRAHHPSAGQLTASHTIPVTIAAEQGLIGELAYAALVLAALVTLLRGTRADPARAAIGAAFAALLFHTFLYADFLEDPVTWALLGIGASLAGARATAPARERSRTRRAAVVPA